MSGCGVRVSMLRPRFRWSSISAAQPSMRGYRKIVNAAVSSASLGERAAAIALPQHLQQQRRDHRIDVDAVDVARHAGVEQRLHQRAIELMEHVVLAALARTARAMNTSRGSMVDRLVLEHRMIDARQLLRCRGCRRLLALALYSRILLDASRRPAPAGRCHAPGRRDRRGRCPGTARSGTRCPRSRCRRARSRCA